MKEVILNNVKRFMAESKITQRHLSNVLNISPQTINNQLNGKCPIGIDIVCGILYNYPEVSAEWLIRGKGHMFSGDVISNENKMDVNTIENSNVNNGGTQTISQSDAEAKLLREQMEVLRNDNEKLNKRIDDLISILAKM